MQEEIYLQSHILRPTLDNLDLTWGPLGPGPRQSAALENVTALGKTGNHALNNIMSRTGRSLIDIIDISTVRSTVDLFGKVKKARLWIRGYISNARLLKIARRDRIGSSWESHRSRMETPSVPDMQWPYDLMLDTAGDVQKIVGSSVTLLAIWSLDSISPDSEVYLLILLRQSLLQRRLRRIGMVRISLYTQIAGKVAEASRKDLLDTLESQLVQILIV